MSPPLVRGPRAGSGVLDKGKESWKQNGGRDRALSLLCHGQRIQAHAPAIEEVRLPGVRPQDGVGRSLYEVRLSQVPADEPARKPLPNLRGTSQAVAPSRVGVEPGRPVRIIVDIVRRREMKVLKRSSHARICSGVCRRRVPASVASAC